VQALEPVTSDQLLMTMTGTAILEANYYVLKDAYAVADCPTGPALTGVLINNSCFTLEVAGAGAAGGAPQKTQSTFSNQMDPSTVGKLVNNYQVSLSDLYTSSYSCQNASNAYGTALDFSNLDLNITGIPPCFYNLPVFQVTPATVESPFQATPCAIFIANSTAPTPEVGLTFLPDNLVPIFTKEFCVPANNVPVGHEILTEVVRY
jgi:hypothetical protein